MLTKFNYSHVRLTKSCVQHSRQLSTTLLRLAESEEVQSPPTRPGLSEQKKAILKRRDYRFAYAEFLPDADPKYRNHTRELLERKDMLARRENVMLPEFYVGSIVAVTTAKPLTEGPEKEKRFVGIVIDRGGAGLRAWMLVRNVVNGAGVEYMFDLYSPLVKDVEVLRLERRLDEQLNYLKDCHPMYSTFPFDMPTELVPEGQPVPVNDIVVPLGPTPWSRRWELYSDRLQGYTFDGETLHRNHKHSYGNYHKYLNEGWHNEWVKYDIFREYMLTIPLEEQDAIWAEVGPSLERRDAMIRRLVAKKALSLSAKK